MLEQHPLGAMLMTEQSSPNLWDYKPWWCQPWSILLTGFGIIIGSWLIFHRYWLTGLVAIPLGAWMGFFLLLYPKMMQESGLLAEMQAAKTQQDQP